LVILSFVQSSIFILSIVILSGIMARSVTEYSTAAVGSTKRANRNGLQSCPFSGIQCCR